MVDTLSPNMTSDVLDGLPFDRDSMFADHKGVYKPRIEKKQRKLAQKVQFLKDFLEDDENLLLITTAVSPTSFFEQWTTGFVFVYIKRCLLVMTNKRLFHIPTTTSFKYRHSIAQIRYSDIDSIAQKGSKLKIRYKNGAKDLFLYIRRSERKKMRVQIPLLSHDGPSSRDGIRSHLCPRCTAVLEQDNYECPNCKLEFKSRKKALKLSIWLPGGGYFYTGHPLLGLGDALVEILLIFAIILSLVPTVELPNPDPAGAIFIGILLVLEKLVTIYHANHFVKEYLPRDKNIQPSRSGVHGAIQP